MREVALADGGKIPALGLGTWRLVGTEATETVKEALTIGYRMIDTASMYGNEKQVGEGLRASGIARDEVFIVTKVWRESLLPDDLQASVEMSLERLGTDYVDGLLIHWPNEQIPLTTTLRVMEKLHEEGSVRHIGVANFPRRLLLEAIDAGISPTMNQIELHPSLQQKSLSHFCHGHQIQPVAHTPFGQGRDLDVEAVKQIAHYRKKSRAQVILNWLWQKGIVAIPKATSYEHLLDNYESQTWVLTEDEMVEMEGVMQQPRLVNPGYVDFDD